MQTITHFRTAAFAFLVAFGSVTPAMGQPDVELLTKSRVARPVTIVPPEFPQGPQAPEGGIRVDVRGSVLLDGSLAPLEIRAQSGLERFAEAVQLVLKWWRFVPALDADACLPRIAEVAFAVWFEGSHQQPRVSLSYPSGGEDQPTPPELMPLESLEAPSIAYPRRLMEVEGKVRALLRIDASGQVASASILSSTPYGVFDELVLRNARQTSAKWKSSAVPQPICVLRPYMFCMGGRPPRLPYAECKR
jgi:TonB family protein